MRSGGTAPRPMVPRGLEPRTLRLLAVRSNQLSYETHVKNSEWGQDPMTPGPQDPRPQDPGHQDPRLQDPPPQDPRPQDPQPHVLKFFKFSLGGLLKLRLTPGSRNARYRTPGSTTPGSRSQDPRPQGSGRQDPPPQDPRPQLFKFFEVLLGRSPQTKFHPRIQDPGGFLCPEKPTAP